MTLRSFVALRRVFCVVGISIFFLLAVIPAIEQYFLGVNVGKLFATDWWNVGSSYTRTVYPGQLGTINVDKKFLTPFPRQNFTVKKILECEKKKDVSNSEFIGTLNLEASEDDSSATFVSNVTFDGSTFRRVILDKVRFFQCSFRNVDFRGLQGYTILFNNCNFCGAYIHTDESSVDNLSNRAQSDFSFKESGDIPLTNVMTVDVQELISTASFQKRNLSGLCDARLHYTADASLYDRVTKKFKLSNFNLMFSNIQELKNANLDNALIRGAIMSITLEQLYSTYDYKHGKLIDMQFHNCNFANGNFAKINLAGTTFARGCNLKNADFTDSKISWVFFDATHNVTIDQIKSTADFKNKKMHHVTVQGIDFSNVDLSGFDLSGSRFHCNLRNTNFTDAIITDCMLSPDIQPDSSGQDLDFFLGSRSNHKLPPNVQPEQQITIEQVKSTWNYKNNYMRGIKLPDEIQKALDAEKQQAKKNVVAK
jgi:uncharacterized protein YjbI with pentapeptide repeats